MGTNAKYITPENMNILNHEKLLEVRMKDIVGLHQKHNEVMDKLKVPVNRIPSDFITQGHTAGVALGSRNPRAFC
eukprot:12914041-Prorocentrum_lima.AAC.1